MDPVPVGTQIRVVRNSNSHDYKLGQNYVVSMVDSDGTFKAKHPTTGEEGNWLKWGDCEMGGETIGWKFCQKVLPAESVSFLSCFEGIEQITLKNEIKDKVLLALPDLYERILEAGAESMLESSNLDDDDD